MSVIYAADTVTVWLNEEAVPDRIVWRGMRYRVTDTPTSLQDLVLSLTHPPHVDGWRFQGTNDAGETHMFDIRPDPLRQEWDLLRVYD